ncbi:AAA family ATPase [Streptomyces sp. NPDC059828]|uniref:AAA family ATPase n=1 Tax=Streptomyces sp. NPDC059828 TaxID=3346965 RepID=UPI00364C8E68
MHDAVGAPLPPGGPGPGQGPAAWGHRQQAQHPAPPPRPPHPVAHQPGPPQGPPGRHPGAPAQHPGPPPQAPPARHPAGPAQGTPAPPQAPVAPGWTAPAQPSHTSVPESPPDSTGYVRLPPGGPVPVPTSVPPDSGTGAATLAVLLIGPAGAGKTTVARHWASARRVPTAHISLDDVREWVCSGFADPQSGWNDQSEAQYRLARRTCGFAARNFLANGISCILDDAVFPDRPVVGLGGWKRHVGPGLLPVVLLPGLDVVLERNAERSGNRRLSDEEVASIHGRMAGWYGSGLPIIDNSNCDVETTSRILDEVLARALASPPAW